MKKLLITFCIIITATLSINAQETSKNTIGLTFRSLDVTKNAEITYQHKIGKRNRLQVDFAKSFKNSEYVITGEYQWIWKLEDKFSWYAGPGIGYSNFGEKPFGFGNIGIEYDFKIPLLLSIENRLVTFNSDDVKFLKGLFLLSARYQF